MARDRDERGGGQSGLGAAFALLREKISNLLIVDENPAGAEGPWVTYARMITLRTPKDLLSIDLGIPSLTFRAFWEAQHGEEGWAQLGKIPREDWMAYLRFYREVLCLPVQNNAKVLKVGALTDGAPQIRARLFWHEGPPPNRMEAHPDLRGWDRVDRDLYRRDNSLAWFRIDDCPDLHLRFEWDGRQLVVEGDYYHRLSKTARRDWPKG